MALLAEERLEIIARYHFFVVFEQSINVLRAALITVPFDFVVLIVFMCLLWVCFEVGRFLFTFFAIVCVFGLISTAHSLDLFD